MVIEGVDAQGDLLSWGSVIDFQEEVMERDSSIRVDGPFRSETEDVFCRLEGWSDGKSSKERAVFL